MSGLVRSVALFMSFAFGVIGMSVGINALVKSNNLKAFVRAAAPPGVSVDINTHDIISSGAVLTVGCGLLALTSLLTFLLTFLRPRARKTHRFSGFLHFFWVVWILATVIAYDVIARNREAKVTAFLAGGQLPDSFVQQQEQLLGVTPKYWPHNYIKLPAILPWFAFLFGAIAGVTLFHTTKAGPDIAHSSRNAAAADESAGKPSTEKGVSEDVHDRT